MILFNKGNFEEEIRRLTKLLAKTFQTEDLGDLKYVPEMEVPHSKEGTAKSTH